VTGRPSTRTDRALEVTIDSSLKIGIFPPAAIHLNLMTVFQFQIDGGGTKEKNPVVVYTSDCSNSCNQHDPEEGCNIVLVFLKTSKIPPCCDLMGTTEAYQVVKLLDCRCGCLGKAAPLTTPSAAFCIRLSIILGEITISPKTFPLLQNHTMTYYIRMSFFTMSTN
jgi:hypothetical protein